MLASPVCDREQDDAKIVALYRVLVDLGLESAPEEPGKAQKALNVFFAWGNDVTYRIFGAKGFLDFCI